MEKNENKKINKIYHENITELNYLVYSAYIFYTKHFDY